MTVNVLKIKVSAAVLSFVLTGCFTGVESTPRITTSDVNRQDAAALSEEQRFIAHLRPDDMSVWQPKKRFIVTDGKADMILQKPGGGYAGISKGDTLFFDRSETTRSITGDSVVDVYFKTGSGQDIVFRSNRASGDTLSQFRVPFILDESFLEDARQLLTGRHLWVKTSVWRDSTDHVVKGIKFADVIIEGIQPGTAAYPLRVDFKTCGLPEPMSGSLMMTTLEQGAGSRTFDGQFSLTDPHLRYPDITDERWQLIMRGLIAYGMTREECRLSLGSPKDLERAAGYSDVKERWLYDNGIYLIFSDGLLVDYRR